MFKAKWRTLKGELSLRYAFTLLSTYKVPGTTLNVLHGSSYSPPPSNSAMSAFVSSLLHKLRRRDSGWISDLQMTTTLVSSEPGSQARPPASRSALLTSPTLATRLWHERLMNRAKARRGTEPLCWGHGAEPHVSLRCLCLTGGAVQTFSFSFLGFIISWVYYFRINMWWLNV